MSKRSILFLVEVKGHLGSTRVEFENVLNTISQEGKLGQLSYLVYHIEYKSLLFLVEVKCHLVGHQTSEFALTEILP